MDFNFANETPHQSKFLIHGPKIKKKLEENRGKNNGLYCYQTEAVLKTYEMLQLDQAEAQINWIRRQKRTTPQPSVIVAPTGSGKSGIIALLPYVLQSQRVLILTPSKVISEQLATALGHNSNRKCFFETSGNIKGDDKQREETRSNLLEQVMIIKKAEDINQTLPGVVIVNAQKFGGAAGNSLIEKADKPIVENVVSFFEKFDTLIVDEAHHYPARTWRRIVEVFSKPVAGKERKIVFLTATPNTYKLVRGKLVPEFILGNDNKERVAFEIEAKDLEGKTIRKSIFIMPEHIPFTETPSNEQIYQNIKECLEYNFNRESRFDAQGMILVKTRDDATALTKKLNELDGTTNFAIELLAEQGNKTTNLDAFTRGEFRVGVTCKVGTEGYDNPNVSVCVICKKIVTGVVTFSQFVGRCKRLKRDVEGDQVDQSLAIVLSYKKYEVDKLYNAFESAVAENDPDDDEDDD